MKRKWLAIGIILLFVGINTIPDVLSYTEYKTSKTVNEMSDDDFEFVGIDHISIDDWQPAPNYFHATIWISVKNKGTTKTTYWIKGGMFRFINPIKYVGKVDHISYPDPWYHDEIRVIPSIKYFGQDTPGIFHIKIKIKGIDTNQYRFYLLWSGYYFIFGDKIFKICRTYPLV